MKSRSGTPINTREGFGSFRAVLSDRNPNAAAVDSLRRSLGDLSESELLKILNSLDLADSAPDRVMADYVLRALAAKNPVAALDAIAGLPEQASAITMIPERYRIMAESKPDAMLDWLAQNKASDSIHVKAAMLPMLLALADLKPAETVSLLATMEPKRRNVFMSSVLWVVAGKDGDLAFRLAKENLQGDDLKNGMSSIVKHVGDVDIDRALAMVDSLDGDLARKCLEVLIVARMRDDQVEVAPLVQKLPAASLQGALKSPGLVERIAKENPEQAKAMVLSLAFTESNKEIFLKLGSSLAAKDPEKALSYVKDLPASPASNEIIGKVYEVMAKSNPDIAIANLAGMSSGQLPQAMRGIVKTIATSDYDRAMDMASNAPAEFRQDVYREIARSVTYAQPARAVSILEDPAMTEKIGTVFRDQMIDYTVRTWSGQDREAARSWVEQLPENDRPKGVQGLMNSWMKSDPVAASEWLAKLPVGPARDAGARVVIEQIKNTDPQMAEQWRRSLSEKTAGQK